MSDLVIYLDEPIKFGDKSITEFVIKEPTTGAVEIASGFLDNTNQGLVRYYTSLIQSVSGLSQSLVKLLPYRKFREARDKIENFMSDGPPTGESSETT